MGPVLPDPAKNLAMEVRW